MEDRRWLLRLVAAVLLFCFAAISWSAAGTKSPTFDEPYHALAAWVQFWHHDFRLDPQGGPLWHDWCALAVGPRSLRADFSADSWRQIPDDLLAQWPWTVQTLYRTPGNDAETFVMRQRAASLVLGVALGLLTIVWANRLGGALAAVGAGFLYAFDPNFVAHAPLVKNDVPFALLALALTMMIWRGGQRLTWGNLFSIALLAAAAVLVKFSGLLFGPILLLMFCVRSFLPQPWPALGRLRTSCSARLMVAIVASALVGLIAYAAVWAVYGFRFAPTPDANISLDMTQITALATKAQWVLQHHQTNPTTRQLADAAPTAIVSAVNWLDNHRLLPQAFLNGFFYQYQAALLRNGYLLGRISLAGQWDYFPLAMLFKTPLATMATGGIGALIALALLLGRAGEWSLRAIWTVACLILPPAAYLASAMTADVNAGIRHVLVIYPFGFVLIGWIAASAWRRWPGARRWALATAVVLGIALIAETSSAFPDYIAFFNVAAGGSRGGIRLLGDSNLDWGQDLKLLAQWQRRNPNQPLYLCYFGLADPAYYGVRYVNLPGGYRYGPPVAWPTEPGVIAISATNLQGIWMQPELYELFYAQFWKFKPKEVLGGSIYLYDFPPD